MREAVVWAEPFVDGVYTAECRRDVKKPTPTVLLRLLGQVPDAPCACVRVWPVRACLLAVMQDEL